MRRRRGPAEGGFTLFELLLVVLLVGMMVLWVTPRLSSFGARDLKWTARRMSGLIRHLAAETSATKRPHRLYYDLSEKRYRVEVLEESGEYVESGDTLARGDALPEGIVFEDVTTAGMGKVTEGEVYTQFHPFGVEKTWIHLRSDDKRWSLEVHPLTGRVTVHDRYVDKATQ